MIAQLDKKFISLRPWKLWSRLLAYFFFEGRPLTTSGQWFNTVVFLIFRLCKKIPFRDTTKNPIFIVGMGRSGTTALGSVLSMHREFAYLNEPKALWHSIYGGEDIIGSYSKEVGTYRIDEEVLDSRSVLEAGRVYSAFLAITRSKRVVDKYPELLFRIPFVKRLYPSAKFILITRNGFDNCSSIDKWCETHTIAAVANEVEDWWGLNSRKWHALVDQIVPEYEDLAGKQKALRALSKNIDRATLEWIITMREGISALQNYPNDVLRIDYEDLCTTPEATTKEILEFVGTDSKDSVFDEYAVETLERKRKPVKPFELNSHLAAEFESTMQLLGYI